MQINDALIYVWDEIGKRAHRAVDGADDDMLIWRPAPKANTIAWLVWHLARVADSFVSEIAGANQVWTTGGWAERFDLPADYDDTGYGHTPEQVAEIAPDAATLLAYLDAVVDMVRTYVAHPDEDYDRIIDESYDPPVSVGIRLMSVVGDAYQHVGQAAYVRGLRG